MQNLGFAMKNCKDTFGLVDNSYNFKLKKPMLCPLCGAFQDGTIVSRSVHPGPTGFEIGVAGYRCTFCSEKYIVIYKISREDKIADFAGFYPPSDSGYQNDTLADTSPRFITSYNQALRAEKFGDIELAAIGYRQALECLVKDYAIRELDIDREKVIKKNLCDAISEYVGEKEMLATADVVRILGNDYAHYERKYPEHDFELLKRYMEIFVKLVETKLLIAHPPVARK